MTDRELLEAAAKAAGYKVVGEDLQTSYIAVEGQRENHGHQRWYWNPLTDDGDALRLAVKLRIDLSLWINTVSVTAKTHIGAGRGISLFDDAKRIANDHAEPFGDDPYAATRRAIVRAAAAMGEKA